MLNDIDFKDRITSYIDGELTSTEMVEFKNTMKSNDELRDLYLQIIENDKLIKEMPVSKTSSDFMLKLNNRIEKYNNSGSITFISALKQFIYNPKPSVAYGAACVTLILSFSIYKISDLDITSFFYSNNPNLKTELSNYVAISESDTLNIDNDSLKNEIFIIGNGR